MLCNITFIYKRMTCIPNTYKTYGINRKYDFTAIVKRNIK